MHILRYERTDKLIVAQSILYKDCSIDNNSLRLVVISCDKLTKSIILSALYSYRNVNVRINEISSFNVRIKKGAINESKLTK